MCLNVILSLKSFHFRALNLEYLENVIAIIMEFLKLIPWHRKCLLEYDANIMTMNVHKFYLQEVVISTNIYTDYEFENLTLQLLLDSALNFPKFPLLIKLKFFLYYACIDFNFRPNNNFYPVWPLSCA